jgi:hypothetical protein
MWQKLQDCMHHVTADVHHGDILLSTLNCEVCKQFIQELPLQIMVKVKLSLCLTKHHTMKTWMYRSTHSLTLALDGGEWSVSCPGCFTPRERAPGMHWIGCWVGLRAGLDTVLKRKISSPHQDSNLDHPIIQPVVICYTV